MNKDIMNLEDYKKTLDIMDFDEFKKTLDRKPSYYYLLIKRDMNDDQKEQYQEIMDNVNHLFDNMHTKKISENKVNLQNIANELEVLENLIKEVYGDNKEVRMTINYYDDSVNIWFDEQVAESDDLFEIRAEGLYIKYVKDKLYESYKVDSK